MRPHRKRLFLFEPMIASGMEISTIKIFIVQRSIHNYVRVLFLFDTPKAKDLRGRSKMLGISGEGGGEGL
jgi:hypothetical protein